MTQYVRVGSDQNIYFFGKYDGRLNTYSNFQKIVIKCIYFQSEKGQ